MEVLRGDIHSQLAVELGKIAFGHLELVQAHCLKNLPLEIVAADSWTEDSLAELLCAASCRILDERGKVGSRRKAARLALGVEPGHGQSRAKAAEEMGISTRGSQPSRGAHFDRLWDDVAVVLLEMSYEILRPADQVDVLRDSRVGGLLIEHIEQANPSKLRFLELSAASVRAVLESAIEWPSVREIQLLLADPRMLSPFHWNTRMLPTLEGLMLALGTRDRDATPISIGCYGYREPPETTPPPVSSRPSILPSLRGRDFDGQLISLGWYMHTPHEEDEQSADSESARKYPLREVWGHLNPLIIARPEDAGFATLQAFFDQQFQVLWNGYEATRGVPPAAPLIEAVQVRDPTAYKDRKFRSFLARVSRKE